MKHDVYLDIYINSNSQFIPSSCLLQKWFKAVIQSEKNIARASLLIVDEDEGRHLNHHWRNKNKATNILSFAAEIPAEVNSPIIGDLVACAPVIELEAKNQGKGIDAHWAHMIIHGGLHLLGYDHILETDAIKMESIETDILSKLGYDNPYII